MDAQIKDVPLLRAGKFLLGMTFFSAQRSNYHGLLYHDAALEVNLPGNFNSFYNDLASHGASVWKDSCPAKVGKFDKEQPLVLGEVDRAKVGHCEGGDARNEEMNKLSKETLSNDIDENSWRKAFQVIPTKVSLTKKLFSDMGKEKQGGDPYFRNNSQTIICIHELLRKKEQYTTQGEFRNFDGVPLNPEFLDFQEVWEKNMIRKFREFAGLPVKTAHINLRMFKDMDIHEEEADVDIVSDEEL